MIDKELFSARLKLLREKNNATAASIAKATGLSTAAISQFENSVNYPHVNTLVALADCFDVSLDYLVGRSADPERHIDRKKLAHRVNGQCPELVPGSSPEPTVQPSLDNVKPKRQRSQPKQNPKRER